MPASVQQSETPLRVIARFGKEIEVLLKDGTTVRASLRQSSRSAVCGDWVETEWLPSNTNKCLQPIAKNIRHRNNLLERIDGFGRSRAMCANIDFVWIVVAPWPPTPKHFIDQFLVAIWNLPAQPGILINKWDCIDSAEGKSLLDYLETLQHLSLPILPVSARNEFGLEKLREIAQGKSNILAGPSGVGKSSLIQALLPERHLVVASDERTMAHGGHTTTVTRWYPTEHIGAWVDSPGIRSFTPHIQNLENLQGGFPDFIPLAKQCQFRNCSHQEEPGCAVIQAVKGGGIPELRLDAWKKLYASIAPESVRNSNPSRNPASKNQNRRY